MFTRIITIIGSEAVALACLYLLVVGNSEHASDLKLFGAAVGLSIFGFLIPWVVIKNRK